MIKMIKIHPGPEMHLVYTPTYGRGAEEHASAVLVYALCMSFFKVLCVLNLVFKSTRTTLSPTPQYITVPKASPIFVLPPHSTFRSSIAYGICFDPLDPHQSPSHETMFWREWKLRTAARRRAAPMVKYRACRQFVLLRHFSPQRWLRRSVTGD